MTETERLASEPKQFRAPSGERVQPLDAAGLRDRHSEINERRAQTEDPAALRRLRSL